MHRRPDISFREWCWSHSQKFSLPDKRSLRGRKVPALGVGPGRVATRVEGGPGQCRYMFMCL
jgi:hypothetical protein